MYKVICNCCHAILTHVKDHSQESHVHASAVWQRHLYFSNEYIDPRCDERYKTSEHKWSYIFKKLSENEIAERKKIEYMRGANL
jgi:hypothetical protein